MSEVMGLESISLLKVGACALTLLPIKCDNYAAEIDRLLVTAGLEKEQLYVDRRLQVNRGKQIKMYRVWIQAKYVKN